MKYKVSHYSFLLQVFCALPVGLFFDNLFNGLKRFFPATFRRRRNFGHSKWLGALHTAAWRRLSRIEVNSLIFLSNSSAFIKSSSLLISGPWGVNISKISSSENPALRANEISASLCRTSAWNSPSIRCRWFWGQFRQRYRRHPGIIPTAPDCRHRRHKFQQTTPVLVGRSGAFAHRPA